MTMHIYIDGKKVEVTAGETILKVARRVGFHIPTLCHHEALEGVGACRLCMVEITHRDWNGWKGLVTACLYPVEDKLEVTINNDAVRRSRQTTLDLLLARCPDAMILHELAGENGHAPSYYKQSKDGSKCIMCYQCIRVCEKVGCSAISAVGRGVHKEVAVPFYDNADACVGCGSCAAICPTGHIEMQDTETERTIWGRTFPFVLCKSCGAPVMTEEYKAFAVKNRPLGEDYYTTCSACKKTELSARFATVGFDGRGR